MRTVILAGGEGTRLRPLTCDIPKPMASLCGKPILEYLFDGLLRAEISSAVLTLGYLPHKIEQKYPNGYNGLSLDFVRENNPLGTAGSVRNALVDCRDSVFVLSGDALCDYDFAEIIRGHRQSGASATIVATKVKDPREYGLLRTDSDGNVTGFIEKPGWSQATGGIANTGIYVLEPDALELIPSDKPFDFAKNLFPLLLKEGKKIHSYLAKGYWCDVGDISSFLRSSRDILDVKCKAQFISPKLSGGIIGKAPKGNYIIKPPVYFGKNLQIGDGATIGPYAILEDGVSVGVGSKIRRSALMKASCVAAHCRVTGSLVCEGAVVKGFSSLFEGSVLGSGAIVGEDSCVNPGVRVWPGKHVEGGCHARENLRYGAVRRELFGDAGLDAGGRLTPRFCAGLGSAMASVADCRNASVAHDGSPRAKAIARALCGGLQFGGASVWDFGECFPAQSAYCAAFGGRNFSLFVRGDTLIASGEGGLPLPRYTERAIEAACERGEESPAPDDKIRDTADMSNLRAAYRQELRRQCLQILRPPSPPHDDDIYSHSKEKPLENMSVTVFGTNALPREILKETLQELGCNVNGGGIITTGRGRVINPETRDLILRLNADGNRVCAWTRETGRLPFEKLLAICCLDEFRRGSSLSLSSDAPFFLDTLARENGCNVMRYLNSPSDGCDAAARRVAQTTPWTRDGLFLSVRLLTVMRKRRMNLNELAQELPAVYVRQSFVNGEPSLLDAENLNFLNGFEPLHAPEGFMLRKGLSKLLILPGKSGKRLRLLAEAQTMEAAAELSAVAEDMINPKTTQCTKSCENRRA